MSNPRAQLRRTGRISLITTALGFVLATGVASPAMAGANGALNKPQPLSNADTNRGGANGQCPGGPYCSTRDGSPSLNGNGNGAATGKPAAGSVGKADNKNPKGQMPNGSDRNSGFECDTNHGIGRSNPAHTGCKSAVPPMVTPPNVTPPKVTPPKVTPPKVTPVVLGAVAEAPAAAAAAAAAKHPLPTSAAAGQANTSGQLIAGGSAAVAALLSLGAGFLLRRRNGVA